MIKSFPLLEKKVLVPRGENQAKSFSQLIEKYGGIPIEIPLIAFRPVEINQRLQTILKALNTYDWIIFTSNVTVETFFSFCLNSDLEIFPKIAVIGKKTEEGLLQRGLRPEFIPSAYVSESFVSEFLPYIHKGSKILLPKGNLAREYIADSLTDCGALVDEVVIYETVMPDESREKLAKVMVEKQLDILLFTSPSTVDHFMETVTRYKLEHHLKKYIFGCIGPSTEKKLRAYGLPVHVAPKEYTVKEMVNSTIAYLEMEES